MAAPRLPSRDMIEQIAQRCPERLNFLVAFFVMEWQSVQRAHGVDQVGQSRIMPNYVGMWGVDTCTYYLRRAPIERTSRGTGYLSGWLKKQAYG